MFWQSGSSVLAACDYVGESLAGVLGITSPKYQYEIDEYKRTVQEEKEIREQESAEMAGWSAHDASCPNLDQPTKAEKTNLPPPPIPLPQVNEAEVKEEGNNSV